VPLVRDQHSGNLVLSQNKKGRGYMASALLLIISVLTAAWLERSPVVEPASPSAPP
jgi:hypothetical protein